jgi:C4-type Zn-finger protein
MICPKCGGEAYVFEEDFIKALENVSPIKLIIKQTLICKSCSERFTRIVCEDTDARKKGEEKLHDLHSIRPTSGEMKEAMDRLRFI